MDQIRIGNFLRELRRQQNLTQEQLAEQLGVSRRTVSRWETGSNLPDLDVLIELSDAYGVGLRELLDGGRRGEEMNEEEKETARKVAAYSSGEKQKLTRRMHLLFLGGLAAGALYQVLLFAGRADGFVGGLCLGITFGMMVLGVLMTGRAGAKLRAVKRRLLSRQ